MAFWSSWFRGGGPSTEDLPKADSPGDPNGVELVGEESISRGMSFPMPMPWDGWPEGWATEWNSSSGMNKLIDTAWACIDLNASVLASMPAYLVKGQVIDEPRDWMINPDPTIYSSWDEFAKQLFWDYQCGEAFVLSMADGADGLPMGMRIIPPWLVNADLYRGRRRYTLGSEDVTDHILHIRYQSSIDDARGHGPLEMAGARMTTAGILQRYARTLAETGGVPHYWMGLPQFVNTSEANELLDVWTATRKRHLGEPAIVSNGATLNTTQSMNAKDMALLELAQFSESRIAILLGVPPFLVGLPSGGDSMTYSNVSQLFDFHDRSSLRPKARAVMSALSQWALPKGECIELNRDEYSRPDFAARAMAYKTLMDAAAETQNPKYTEQIWNVISTMERFHGLGAGSSLTGNNQAATQPEVKSDVGRTGYRPLGR